MDMMQRAALKRAQAALDVALDGTMPTPSGAVEFVQLAAALMVSNGDFRQARERISLGCNRALGVLEKAAVSGGSIDSPQWAAQLAGYSALSDSFAESLRTVSPFDQILPSTRRTPMRTRIGTVTSGATGAVVAAGMAAPVSKMTLVGSTLEPQKAAGIVVLSDELLAEAQRGAGFSMLQRELSNAVSTATNVAFFSAITSGAPSHASGGATAALILADLNTMLGDLSIGATSRLFFVLSASNCAKMAMKLNTSGQSAFPNLAVTGGDVAGVTVIPSDALTTSALLIDADSIAADSDTITLAVGRYGSLQMDDAPTNTPLLTGSPQQPVPVNLVSLMQSNSTALRATRFFGAQRFRSGVSILTSISW